VRSPVQIRAACWDPVTIAHFERIGVDVGWSCLEVGGGGGSLGAWLGRRVGESGSVLVTDIDPRWIGSEVAANVEVRRHDIVNDELEEGRFDLAHARLVLLHLPERDRVLAKMISALKPGGWLLIDDFDCSWLPFVPSCTEDADAELFLKAADAFHKVLEWGARAIALAEQLGDREALVHALNNVGVVEMALGRAEGEAKLAESLALSRQAGLGTDAGRACGRCSTRRARSRSTPTTSS
jgi:SAM-dependent methyltransferase